ncbi:MAG: hypothetical protein Q7T10_16170 [Rhodoferax sp.]|uniref:hypothetical protein n=1 Tax=Rhodoferax sp. TaxID=50421 RepID=UPI00271A5FC5|nr:hypothetical protein [Rhodoferax sp.]MDO8450335.1 hypothetical protein [Rhodoferax sp.]
MSKTDGGVSEIKLTAAPKSFVQGLIENYSEPLYFFMKVGYRVATTRRTRPERQECAMVTTAPMRQMVSVSVILFENFEGFGPPAFAASQ